MKTKQPKPIFIKALGASTVILFFGAYLYYTSLKTKTGYEAVNGKIDYIANSYDNLHPRDHRFIHLNGQEQVFDIFIGKQTGDFSPKFEKLDALKVGDEIIVYHSGTTPLQKNRDLRLNKNVEYIDKDNEPFFIRGNKNRFGGYAFMGIGGVLILVVFILKGLKKID